MDHRLSTHGWALITDDGQHLATHGWCVWLELGGVPIFVNVTPRLLFTDARPLTSFADETGASAWVDVTKTTIFHNRTPRVACSVEVS